MTKLVIWNFWQFYNALLHDSFQEEYFFYKTFDGICFIPYSLQKHYQ